MITFASASGTPLTNLEAFTRLDAAGISVSSSGGCDDKTKKQCTSLDGVLSDTIDGIITLKRACGCSINITGGTEIGHKNEPYSHGTGYKLDISKYPEVSSYIKRTFKRIDDRPTGEPHYA
ncbi:hypothetical protein FBU30_004635 [Linnemannia zychae]|nr:hypothetical protein FBU30_004635 [Linnemannia zychae]